MAPEIIDLVETMCLLFFSYQATPGHRLVVAANRDEFLCRPTAPLAFLDEEKTILAGRDMQGGGTWLGITAQMKFAAITNYRDPQVNKPDAPSRGEILMDYLAGSSGAGQYLLRLAGKSEKYNGFNLVLGDREGFYYYSNRSTGVQRLGPGFYGLSNNLLDVPWPKVERGKKLLHPHMVATDRIDAALLLDLLEDDFRPPDDQLPDTKVGLDWERLLGSIFINGVDYGTRSSAVITVTETGQISFFEKTILRSPVTSLSAKMHHLCINS